MMKSILTIRWGLPLGLAVLLAGCGGKPLPPPTMTNYGTIAVAPLLSKDPSMGMLTSRDFVNQVGITLRRSKEDIQLIVDESDARKPVAEAMAKLSLKPDEVYRDPKLAAKVAQELKADVLLVGKLDDPNLKTIEDDKPVYDMASQAGISGTTKFTLIRQNAYTDLYARLVGADGTIIWQSRTPPPKEPGGISVYAKYVRAYQSQVPDKPPVEDTVIIAHLRDLSWKILAHELLPSNYPEIKVPVWKELPNKQFKDSGGMVKFE